jgi:hypothetical protein
MRRDSVGHQAQRKQQRATFVGSRHAARGAG